MKIIRDTVYVQKQDLEYLSSIGGEDFGINIEPGSITKYNRSDFTRLVSEKAISFVKKESKILDFDHIRTLTEEQLEELIKKYEDAYAGADEISSELSATDQQRPQLLKEMYIAKINHLLLCDYLDYLHKQRIIRFPSEIEPYYKETTMQKILGFFGKNIGKSGKKGGKK